MVTDHMTLQVDARNWRYLRCQGEEVARNGYSDGESPFAIALNAHQHQREGKVTAFQVTANVFHKFGSPSAFETKTPDRSLVDFLGPVTFSIGASAYDKVIDISMP